MRHNGRRRPAFSALKRAASNSASSRETSFASARSFAIGASLLLRSHDELIHSPLVGATTWAPAAAARAAGWAYRELTGMHLHMLADPAAVAQILVELVREVALSREA